MNMLSYLKSYAKKDNVSFHMPGHKGSGIFRMCGFDEEISMLADMDITEIPGADNLYCPDGIIKDVQERYEKIYGSKKTHILINGSSCGIMAAIMASISPGDKLLIARNCHKSVYNGLALAGGEPVYIMPQMEEEFYITGEISSDSVRRALEEDDKIAAVIITSPNYYGICSDIKEIAEVVHEFGKILIVDQAHGAHLKLFESFMKKDMDMPQSGESGGADIVINSTHKTLATFTQSAIINVMSYRVDEDILLDKLQILQSTSPSYILMLSHYMNVSILEKYGENLFTRWYDSVMHFYKKAANINGLKILKSDALDKTKINISFASMGMSGAELEQKLLDRGIYAELSTGNILMAMSGIGNEKRDYDRLLKSLEEISVEVTRRNRNMTEKEDMSFVNMPPANKYVGIFREWEQVQLDDCEERVSASIVAPYPPGIPFLCPGEKISPECVAKLQEIRKEKRKIYGLSKEGNIRVFKN